jgi:hypothetical protein
VQINDLADDVEAVSAFLAQRLKRRGLRYEAPDRHTYSRRDKTASLATSCRSKRHHVFHFTPLTRFT